MFFLKVKSTIVQLIKRSTIVQLIVVVLLFPSVLLVLNSIVPDFLEKFISGICDNVKVIGDLYDVFEMSQSVHDNFQDGYIAIMEGLINVMQDNIVFSMIIGFCVLFWSEIQVLFFDGVPIFAVVLGTITGILVLMMFEAAEFSVLRIEILVFLSVLDYVIIIVTEIGTQFITKLVGIFFSGIQAIIWSTYFGYIFCIILSAGNEAYVSFLSLTFLITFVILEFTYYLLGCAKRWMV